MATRFDKLSQKWTFEPLQMLLDDDVPKCMKWQWEVPACWVVYSVMDSAQKNVWRALIDLQCDLGQNPGDGPAVVDHLPWSFKSLRLGQLGITLASGGWSWRNTTPGLDPPTRCYQQRGTIVGSMENSFEFDFAACDKGVFSADVCVVQSLNGHCPNGGRKSMVLATSCALLMISLFLQNRLRKSVMY